MGQRRGVGERVDTLPGLRLHPRAPYIEAAEP